VGNELGRVSCVSRSYRPVQHVKLELCETD
jgi:hypothetical protein